MQEVARKTIEMAKKSVVREKLAPPEQLDVDTNIFKFFLNASKPETMRVPAISRKRRDVGTSRRMGGQK